MHAQMRRFAAMATIVLVAAACGARVTDAQRASLVAKGGAARPSDAPVATETGPVGPGAVAGTQSTVPPAAGTGTAAATGGAASADNGGATDVGVTATSVTVGNVATLSGPVPGVFEGALVGTIAAIAEQNGRGGIAGRRIKLDARDDALDTGTNRAETIDLLGKAFAFAGSFSSFDDAAAPEIGASHIPDVSVALTSARRGLANNYSPAPSPRSGAPTGAFHYFGQRHPDAVKAVGTIYFDIAKGNQADYKAAAEASGWHFAYERGIQATETDFTADVVRMKQSGVKSVFLVALDAKTDARIVSAMAGQGFKPEFVLVHGSAYDRAFLGLAGAAAEGVYNAQPFSLFAGEDAAAIDEVRLFNQWVQKVRPGFSPDLYAAYGWSSARLLFQAMAAAGPKLTRQGVDDALAHITNFSDNGLLAPAGPGTKRPPDCFVLAQVRAGRFERVDPPAPGYRCGDGPYLTRQP